MYVHVWLCVRYKKETLAGRVCSLISTRSGNADWPLGEAVWNGVKAKITRCIMQFGDLFVPIDIHI